MNESWEFFLTYLGEESKVPEPLGWDAVEFIFRRSETLGGLELEFSDTLEFDGIGAEIIKEAYDTFGIDADVKIRITQAGCEFSYDGIINYQIYQEGDSCEDCYTGGPIKVGIKQASFNETFKNRLEVGVNLDAEMGLDGNVMSVVTVPFIKLHSKEILYLTKYKINEFLADFDSGGVSSSEDNPGNYPSHASPWQVQQQDVEGTLEPSFYVPPLQNALFYSGFSYPPGVSLRTLRIKGRLKGNAIKNNNFSTGERKVVLVSRGVLSEIEIETRDIGAFTTADNATTPFDIEFDEVMDFPPDSNLFFVFQHNSNINIVYDFSVSTLELSEHSVITPSTTRAYFLEDAFKRITESITGRANAFKSDLLSKAMLGEAACITLTNGLNIRQMKDKDGSLYPITCSFKQLFDAVDAIFCVLMRIEKDEDGVEYIRLETRDYFYQKTLAQSYNYVPSVNKSIALDKLYNEFEIGYAKWETEAVNGLDEFNTKRNYSLPLKAVKKKLSVLSSVIASGYAIELTRRQQFKENSTSDFSTDNDLFFISTNRTEVESNLYELDELGNPLTVTYNIGQVAERNELFSGIINLLSPETSYNLRLSPARMARRWYPVIASSLYKRESEAISFVSGTGNYQMQSVQEDEFSPGAGVIAENSDLLASAIRLDLSSAIYHPETYEYTVPMSFDEFLLLKEQVIYAYGHSCTNASHAGGYIMQVGYEPNKEGGFAKFKNIRANLT